LDGFSLRARLLNAFVGCMVGALFLAVGGAGEWKLLIAMAASTLVSMTALAIC
jgi:hypothetical protein